MRILIVNGPNIINLKNRDHKIYACFSYKTLVRELKSFIKNYPKIKLKFFVSNCEGKIIDRIIKNNFDSLVINPGGLSHTSVALLDALYDFHGKKIEVHLSKVTEREDFRKNLITRKACDYFFEGMGVQSYIKALEKILKEEKI